MIKIKNYLLQSEIGHGKYGKGLKLFVLRLLNLIFIVVYKGKNLETEEIVAIKKI